jgi:hypothetical protein
MARPGRTLRWIGFALVALALWIGWDLFGPLRTDFRVFEPNEVARLDTAMWRSYYDRKPLVMFGQLAELMRKQFHFPLFRSYVVAARAARAAFVFKDGKDRGDYRRALPDLIAYYSAIEKSGVTPFDVQRTAELELEWWIVHRQRDRYTVRDLERVLAEAAAELYRVPVESMSEYARQRTEAMVIRDTKAKAGGVKEEDWARIEDHLQASWRSLSAAVRPPGVISRAE